MKNIANAETSLAKKAEQITKLRLEIDKGDAKIVKFLAKRSNLVKKIGEIKRKAGLAVCDSKREIIQFARYVVLAKQHNISPEEVCMIFHMIVYYSKLAQRGLSLEKLRQRRPPGKIPKQ